MRVRYTPDIFRFQRAGGVSRYFVELSKGVQARGVDARIVGGLHINDLVEDAPRTRGANVGRLRPARAWQALSKATDFVVTGAIVESLRRGDVVHPTWYPPHLDRLPARASIVTTVFDMIPERFPELAIGSRESSRRKRAWVDAADHVLVISEHTRHDLVEIFGVEPDRVTVTPLGVSMPAPGGRAPSSAPSSKVGSPFLLYVGDRVPPYKNFRRLLEAMTTETVPRELRLVCCGPAPQSAEEGTLLAQLGLASMVEFRSASDDELAALYQAAAALVYPSIYEGFGLPPLEAMVNGCPVVAADAASIPEVVGDAAVLFDPFDVDALAKAIATVVDDPTFQEDLVDRGHRRAAGFTWDSTVEQTLSVYRQVAGAST